MEWRKAFRQTLFDCDVRAVELARRVVINEGRETDEARLQTVQNLISEVRRGAVDPRLSSFEALISALDPAHQDHFFGLIRRV